MASGKGPATKNRGNRGGAVSESILSRLAIEELAERWWDQIPTDERWIPEAVDALRAHQCAGHVIVLLSGSANFILAPIAEEIGVDCILSISLGILENGICNGEIVGIQTIGEGKREALAQLTHRAESNAKLVGYGDHESDLSFLAYCDEAFVLIPHGETTPGWAKGLKQLVVKML